MANQTGQAVAASDSLTAADVGRFTVAVFQDVNWAERGLEALKRAGFPNEAISIIAKSTPDAAAFVDRALGGSAAPLDVKPLGPLVARGPLVDALQGTARDLATAGLADAMRRVGFQGHDGLIFETLTGRGGVLIAVRSEPRAADALAIFHCYGGGNAAIGAWLGRV